MVERALEFIIVKNHIQLYAAGWMLELFHNAQKIHHNKLRRHIWKKRKCGSTYTSKNESSSFLLFLLEEYVELMYH